MDSPATLFLVEFPLPEQGYLPGRNSRVSTGFPAPELPLENHPLVEDRCLLRGIDLFNHGFFYEAHEAWEHLWIHLEKGSPERLMFQGLIQISAAFLKLRLQQPDPALSLWKRGSGYLHDAISHLGVAPFRCDLHLWLMEVEPIIHSRKIPEDGPPRLNPDIPR